MPPSISYSEASNEIKSLLLSALTSHLSCQNDITPLMKACDKSQLNVLEMFRDILELHYTINLAEVIGTPLQRTRDQNFSVHFAAFSGYVEIYDAGILFFVHLMPGGRW